MNLEELRQKIDNIDKNLIEFINERTKIALEIGKIKSEQNIPFYKPERERLIMEKLQLLNKGPFPTNALKLIFLEMMSACRGLEKNIVVAYLGPEASHSHSASISHFGSSVQSIPLTSITDVFYEVEKGKADYGLVPVENSYEGLVTHTLDMFMESPLKICSETLYKVTHCLLSLQDDIGKIKKIYSHPQIFAQCRLWIENHLPHAEKIEASSSSKAAELVEWDKYSAAIATEHAAYRYNLKILENGIEDIPKNYTRFLVIGKTDCDRTGTDKTSIMIGISDKPGALVGILQPFAKRNINLTKIESRPTKKMPWDYVFFIDCEGHITDQNIIDALNEIKPYSLQTKILGSYPRSIIKE
ncbi:MAG: prephenate dehydratase [Spirochaetota bacterium]